MDIFLYFILYSIFFMSLYFIGRMSGKTIERLKNVRILIKKIQEIEKEYYGDCNKDDVRKVIGDIIMEIKK